VRADEKTSPQDCPFFEYKNCGGSGMLVIETIVMQKKGHMEKAYRKRRRDKKGSVAKTKKKI
jgi:hypothetical protein